MDYGCDAWGTNGVKGGNEVAIGMAEKKTQEGYTHLCLITNIKEHLRCN